MTASDFRYGIATSTSGSIECQSIFTTNPVVLAQSGDYIQMTVVFTNNTGILTATCLLGFGLYNGGQTNPVLGGMFGTAVNANTQAGGANQWAGYVGQLAFNGASSRIMTRAPQTSTTANNQDVIGSGSGTLTYNNPAAATIGTASPSTLIFTNGNVYTEVLTIALAGPASEAITNVLYSGPNTNSPVFAQFGGISTNATFMTSAFDALGIGWRATANTTGGTIIDISSIQINGHVSALVPPVITAQPTPAVAATNGYAEFNVAATGVNVTYQWFRNGAALANGGNISGATSTTLAIAPCTSADALSGANGYYCKVSGSGGFSTNSVTNSLTLFAATNLTWVGANNGGTWDLNTTANFVDPGNNPQVFIGGDAVAFNDAKAQNFSVNVTGDEGPSSMTVNTASAFSFTGSGAIVGPGSVTLSGSGTPAGAAITMSLNNTYSGGTTITNGLLVQVENYNDFGTGPVNVNDENSTMEFTTTGSATVGVNGQMNVNSDYTMQLDGLATFSVVFLNNLVCAPGKTLTFTTQNPGVTNRIRIYGTNAVCNGNIVLNGPSVPNQALFYGMQMAPYLVNGTQIYNGAISGGGGIVQRGTGDSIYTGPNTYSGGTFPTAGNIGIGADSAPSLASSPLGVGALVLAPEVGSASGTGGIYAYGGAHTIANPVIYPSNTNSQTLLIGGTNALTLSGSISLNGADGTAGPIVRTFQVTNTALTTFSGAINDAGQVDSLTKTGNGVLALTSAESYSGTNTVLAGTLLVNNSLITLAMNVGTNATLGGSGTITGPVTLTNGATIQPGNQAIGTLTINGTLTMQSSTNYFMVSKTGNLKSVITATTVNYGGTLFATNIAGTSVIGDNYTIFNAGSHTGNFAAVTGSPGSGLAWSFNTNNGVLSVVQGVNTNPAPIVVSVSGNQLTLSWPADHIGWQLQAQTNILGKGLGTNWANVAGTTTVGTNTVTMNSTNPAVFYRMILP